MRKIILRTQSVDRAGRFDEPEELCHIQIDEDWKGDPIYLDEGNYYLIGDELVHEGEVEDFAKYLIENHKESAIELLAGFFTGDYAYEPEKLSGLDIYEKWH